MNNIYLIAPDKVKSNSVIDANVSDRTVKNAIIDVQDTILEPVIGTEMLNRLYEFAKNPANEGEETREAVEELIKTKVAKTIIAGVVVYLIDDLIYQYGARGVSKNRAANEETMSQGEMYRLKNSKEKILGAHVDSLRRYLAANTDTFPEYRKVSPEGLEASDIDDFGIYFHDETE